MSTVETKQSLWKPSINCIICVCSFVLIVILSEIFLGHYLYKTLEHDLRKQIVNDFRNGVFKEEILQILEDPETSTQYLRFLNKKDKNDVKYAEFYKPGVFYDDNNSDSDSWTWPTDYSRIPVKAIEGFCKAINQHCPESVTSKRKRRQLYYNRVVHTDDRLSDGRRDSGVRGFYGDSRSSRSGEPGLPGPPGPIGPPGRSGPPGIPGPAGPPGPIGPPGVQGPIGNTGDRGDIGMTGLKGDQGLPGEKGDAGLSGPPGVPGPQGTPGNSGLQGHPGPQGHIGPLGLQGFPGDQGPPGPPGIQGEAGLPGLDGSPGLEGPIGLPGVDGSPGVPGEEGLPGLDGVPGSNGIDGLPGPPGPAGSQGSPGLQGPSGVCQCCADALNEPSVRVPKWEIRPYGTEQYSGYSPRKMEYMLEYIESPVNYGISNDFKSWMVDSDMPTDEDTEKFWVTTEDNYTLFEYDNKASFLLNTPTRSYDLYIPFEGTSNVVYKGSFFYKAAQSKSRIIKYFLNNQSSQALSIPNLNAHNLKYLYNTGYNYFDFSVDDNGLWVIFAVPYTNNTGVMKVDPDTMTTQYIWNITLDHTKFNEMFVASGFLYTIDKSIKNEMKISFAVDLYTKKLFHVDLNSAEHVQDITMATYDYRWKELLLLDNGTRSAYPVVFGENNFVRKEVFPE